MMRGGEVNYGAIEEGDKTFDADQMRYLGEKKLTQKEKYEKIFRVGFPLLASLAILAVAFLLLTSFLGKSFPGHSGSHGGEPVVTYHGSGSSTAASTTAISKTDTSSSTSAKTESTKTKHSSMAQCSAHDLCGDLLGDCCPTDTGLTLECCKS